MSLLIKALANAEKDKQAERNKTQANEGGLSLELAPKEDLKLAEDTKQSTPQKTATQLSLEEEAGLGALSVPAKKPEPASEKSLVDKPVAKTPTGEMLGQANVQAGVKPQSSTQPAQKPAERATQAFMVENNQKAAAKVFVANQAAKPPSSIGTLLLLGAGGALLAWLGLQGYMYFTKPAPATVATQAIAPALPPVATQNTPTTAPEAVVKSESADKMPQDTQASEAFAISAEAVPEKLAHPEKPAGKIAKQNPTQKNTAGTLTANEALLNDDAPAKASRRAEKQTNLKLTSKSPAAGVDPTLLAAYQAFTRGEDASAQQQYRQVLQQDVRNVDALLGMAAIAQRQGRDADAVGWYQKVLEVNPQNSIAQSALAGPQAHNDVVSAESRIKSMIAQQPEAAHLHAALGNIYAEQNQWESAQGAYFDASQFAPVNADYAFNLAVSLDQMGKQKQALAQYQRALELLNQSGGTSPDKATLEARIQTLQ